MMNSPLPHSTVNPVVNESATALHHDKQKDTMQVSSRRREKESAKPSPDDFPNIEVIEIDGSRIVMEFATTHNPSVEKTIKEMLTESFKRRNNL